MNLLDANQIVFTLLSPAYIGPGAGLAITGSLVTLFAALFSTVYILIRWPFRWAFLIYRGLRHPKMKAKVDRVLVIGFDGMEPFLVEPLMNSNVLCAFRKLADKGCYHRLQTTWPPLSPVAWSAFSTGTNPGKHNIFDFVSRQQSSYLSRNSSVQTSTTSGRAFCIGKLRIPFRKARSTRQQMKLPFWHVLSDAGYFSAILRVPITFPPDQFNAVQLSAMATPDLYGSQGTYLLITDGPQNSAMRGGVHVCLYAERDRFFAKLPGPTDPLHADHPSTSCRIKIEKSPGGMFWLIADNERHELRCDQYTPWVRLTFRLITGQKVYGICRFLLRQTEPHIKIYATPIQIDPEKPAVPISHPGSYSNYLRNTVGRYATLGLAEDTSALNEQTLDDQTFLEQTRLIHEERRRMLLDSLKRVKKGAVVCVFDAPDRIQHMFYRYLRDQEPRDSSKRDIIKQMMIQMDQTLAQVLENVDDQTAVIVMSDHGFADFSRALDLNAWLCKNEYMKLKDDQLFTDEPDLQAVDWSRTRAYAFGLAGIFLNVKGREPEGIVQMGDEQQALAKEISQKLTGLRDPINNRVAIRQVISSSEAYSGPYSKDAPDLLPGYERGYRVSWESASGKVARNVFSDNTRPWSGDHCIHPDCVPGILISNQRFTTGKHDITDLAPTILDLLGVKKPSHYDGKSLLCEDVPSTN